MRPQSPWYQSQAKTAEKRKKERKLQANITSEHRFKNTQQNSSNQNSPTHYKVYTAWSAAAAAAKSLQSCLTLCDPTEGSPPGFPVPGILQARILEWVAISFSNAWKWKVIVKLLSHIPTLLNPIDCNLPGSSVHGIFKARILEWVAISFSRGSSRPRDWT